MKVCLITGGLEHGKSGVGDYTYLLAMECERLGVPSCCVALNDGHVSGRKREQCEGIPVLRLGKDICWTDKKNLVQAFLAEQKSTCVSLQYVAYAYDPRGIARGMARHFRAMIGTLPVHLMCHEIWRGSDANASLKERLIGWIQRRSFVSLIRQLQPRVIHTSNPSYATLLQQRGVNVSVLPLFGHIPIPESNDHRWLYEEMRNGGVEIDEQNRSDYWIFGMFGTLHPVWEPEPFLPLVIAAAKKNGKKVILVSSGRIGGGGEELWRGMAARYTGSCAFHQLHERSPTEIGQFFQFIDFGVAATPWAIIGKSSAAASMLGHGVPVIVTRDELEFKFPIENNSLSPLLVKMTPQLGEQLPMLTREEPVLQSRAVARQFLTAMETAGGILETASTEARTRA